MEKTKIRTHVLATLKLDAEDHHDEIRAAIAVFIMLGRVYTWPIEHYDSDLKAAIKASRSLLTVTVYQESEELINMIGLEATELESRTRTSDDEGANQQRKPWWKVW